MASHWIQTTLVLLHLLPYPVAHPHGAWGRNSSREGKNGMGEIPSWHVGNPESQESIPILPSSCNANSCYIITCQISLLALQGGEQTSLPFPFFLQRAQRVCFLLALSTCYPKLHFRELPTSNFLETGLR